MELDINCRYSCPVCKFTTLHKSNINRHIKRFHYDYYYYNILLKRQNKNKGKVTKTDFIKRFSRDTDVPVEITGTGNNNENKTVATNNFNAPTGLLCSICQNVISGGLDQLKIHMNQEHKTSTLIPSANPSGLVCPLCENLGFRNVIHGGPSQLKLHIAEQHKTVTPASTAAPIPLHPPTSALEPTSQTSSPPPPPLPPPPPPINSETVVQFGKNNFRNNKRSRSKSIDQTSSPSAKKSRTESNQQIKVVKRKDGVIIGAGELEDQCNNSNEKKIFDVRLIPCFKLCVFGPSRSGKSTLIKDILLNIDSFSSEPPKKIILIYVVWQPIYDEMKQKGLVDVFLQDNSDLEQQLTNYIQGEEILFIFDDMINSVNIKYISELFMVQGRHKNISLIFISQQSFRNSDDFRAISNNTNYIILMKNERNLNDVINLSKQATPGKDSLLLQIYKKATSDGYSYLFINFTHECTKETKYMSHLFAEDHIIRCYVPT